VLRNREEKFDNKANINRLSVRPKGNGFGNSCCRVARQRQQQNGCSGENQSTAMTVINWLSVTAQWHWRRRVARQRRNGVKKITFYATTTWLVSLCRGRESLHSTGCLLRPRNNSNSNNGDSVRKTIDSNGDNQLVVCYSAIHLLALAVSPHNETTTMT